MAVEHDMTDSDRLDRVIVLLEALCRAQGVRPRSQAKATWSPGDIDMLPAARAMNPDPEATETGEMFPESTVESLDAWRKQTDREAKRDTARPRTKQR
jgi:hypothetical protein